MNICQLVDFFVAMKCYRPMILRAGLEDID